MANSDATVRVCKGCGKEVRPCSEPSDANEDQPMRPTEVDVCDKHRVRLDGLPWHTLPLDAIQRRLPCPGATCPYSIDVDRTTTPDEWHRLHGNHDLGMRHKDGRLYSSTCHTCGLRWIDGHVTRANRA